MLATAATAKFAVPDVDAVPVILPLAASERPAGSAPQGFAVAGADGRFRVAQARLEGRRVVAWHPDIPEPAALRFGWVDNPQRNNLHDGAGWPRAGPASDKTTAITAKNAIERRVAAPVARRDRRCPGRDVPAFG